MSNQFKIREPDWAKALWLRVKGVVSSLESTVSSITTDLSGKKNTQNAVSDPSASGTSVTFIDSISQNAQGVILPTKKTVKTMAGASSGAAGATGLVPVPAAGDEGKYLKGDGTWGTPSSSGEVNVINSISLNGTNVPPDSNKNVALSETDPTVPAWAKAASKPTYTAAEVGALPSSTTIPSKTSDLTNDGNGTSRFATMDDISGGGGGGNPDIVLNGSHTVSTVLAAISGMAEKESCTFFASNSAIAVISENKIQDFGMGCFGVIVRNNSNSYNYSLIASVATGQGWLYICHFTIDAQQSTVTATAYSIQGTAL